MISQWIGAVRFLPDANKLFVGLQFVCGIIIYIGSLQQKGPNVDFNYYSSIVEL